MTQSAAEEHFDPLGRMVRFSDGRVVFLAENNNSFYIGFKNAKGTDSKFVLSNEAFKAFVALATNPEFGQEATFPHKTEWRVVRNGNDA